MSTELDYNPIDDYLGFVLKPRHHFETIVEVAEFIGMDMKWCPPHILKWSDLWERSTYLQIIASVGHLKSNWMFLEIVRILLNDQNAQILFCAESDHLASQMTLRVKEALTCEAVREIYGDLRGDIWSGSQLYLRGRLQFLKGANLFSTGTRGSIEGTRYFYGFLDDPVALKSSLSLTERGYTETWLDNQFWPRIDWQMGGQLLVIGSYWNPYDLYHYMSEKHHIPTKVFPAHDENYGSLLWPETFNQKQFEEIRNHLPEPAYQMRYLCNADAMTGKGLKLEWLQMVKKNDVPWGELLYNQGWDLAISTQEIVGTMRSAKSEPDYTAGIVTGMDKLGNIYIVDLYLDRIIMGYEDIIEKMYLKWPRTSNQGIESNQFQALVCYLARQKQSAMPVVDVPHYAVDKVTRIGNLIPYFKTRRVFLLEDLPHLDKFIAEYTAFPTEAQHDDILDALEIAIKLYATENVLDLSDYLKGLF